jgi:hypothetical protein
MKAKRPRKPRPTLPPVPDFIQATARHVRAHFKEIIDGPAAVIIGTPRRPRALIIPVHSPPWPTIIERHESAFNAARLFSPAVLAIRNAGGQWYTLAGGRNHDPDPSHHRHERP